MVHREERDTGCLRLCPTLCWLFGSDDPNGQGGKSFQSAAGVLPWQVDMPWSAVCVNVELGLCADANFLPLGYAFETGCKIDRFAIDRLVFDGDRTDRYTRMHSDQWMTRGVAQL